MYPTGAVVLRFTRFFPNVSDFEPDWNRIQSGQWIRILEGKNDSQK